MGKKSGKKRRKPGNDVDIPGLSNNKNQGKNRKKQRKQKVKVSTLPILEEKGKINFEYGGDRTEQRFCFRLSVFFVKINYSKDDFKQRKNDRLEAENDCFIKSDDSDSDIEVKELPHRDFVKAGNVWGDKAQRMMEKMGKKYIYIF